MAWRYLPNVITGIRVLLVMPLVYALLTHHFVLALVLFAVAGVSDGVDGFLARRFNWYTQLGAMLDPLADKLLLVSTYLCLAWLGFFPVWFVALVVGRDLIIFCGAISY